MQEKAQAWLGNLLDWGKSRQSSNAEKLYVEAIRLARAPHFYQKYGVADSVDGRFDALSLIVILLMRRLKPLGEEGKVLSQELFDSMFADMDLSLREMGAGDTGVAKRIRVMAEAFLGRLNSYVQAIDKNDKKQFSSALKRNLFRGNETIDPVANGLVDYLFDLVEKFDHFSAQALLAGRITVT
ncbi:hypothetical protein N8500_06165 [Candidatus Puniceispirillum sp.]|nr:hypothetical protein [Candidatus Puniceispirillum sp.]